MEDELLSQVYSLLSGSSTPSIKQMIEDKKNDLGITSDRQLAKIVGIDQNTLERLVTGDTKKVDLFSLLKLNSFLGVGIERLTQVFVASLRPEFVGELERTRKAAYILRNFDISALKKVGFLNTTTDFEAIEKRIVKFFGLESIFQYDSEIGAALFSRTRVSSSDKMRDFWLRSAMAQFEKVNNPNPYDRQTLVDLVPKIRPYTRHEERGLKTVVQALYHAGVTVIVQPYLNKTQVRGGTFIVKGKPCIVITDFNKKYPTLWFTLLHEIAHVLFHQEKLKTMRYHLTGEADLMLMEEDDANTFAREILFPQEKLDYIRSFISNPLMVKDFAEKNKVHPGIIYNFYCYNEKEEYMRDTYPFYQSYFGHSDVALQELRNDPWNKETLLEHLEIIRQTLASA